MMKKLLIIACLLVVSGAGFATNLQANLDYCKFYAPKYGHYLETYLSLSGNSLSYKKVEDGSFMAEIQITYTFRRPSEEDIVKTYIITPVVQDTSVEIAYFLDQSRIFLDTGKFDFEIKLQDLNSDAEGVSTKEELVIKPEYENVFFSDVLLFDTLVKATEESRYNKNGYEFTPYSSNFYPETVDKISFYVEIYNSDKVMNGEEYLITYFIENQESGKVINNYKSFKKKPAKEVNVVANSFYIKELPSGNYNLVIQARDRENELIKEQKVFFQRSNPSIAAFTPEEKGGTFVENFLNADTLAEHIRSLEPISDRLELEFAENQLEEADLGLMQQYFLNFWVTRNPEDPEKAWSEYARQVLIVNKNYSTRLRKGYLTDRGFRYLKYGPPNIIDRRYNEPSTYPYEIWQYYQVNGQANRRFIFWRPRSVASDFELLHSDVFGEIQNPQWRYKLTIGNAAAPLNTEMNRPAINQFGSNPQSEFRDR